MGVSQGTGDWETPALAVHFFRGLLATLLLLQSWAVPTRQLCIFSMESGGSEGTGLTPWACSEECVLVEVPHPLLHGL